MKTCRACGKQFDGEGYVLSSKAETPEQMTSVLPKPRPAILCDECGKAAFEWAENHKSAEQVTKELGLGATGNFPEGKIHPSDEGELRIAIGHDAKTVIVQFGKAVAWIGFEKAYALEFARLITEHANQLP